MPEAKVYITSAPATQSIGTPTQRRQSSTTASMPIRPIMEYIEVIDEALFTSSTKAS